ncbi:dTDP-4-amino-4,6-dideoxy-D-galactose acyltransferase [Chimaeribacter arupi]|uniref:dTDP-fucosamine acetyltransferase n=2 Tax=Yersiniaceae TaxID=1903411 RepID=A0A2N5EIR8_9GAMM|nr:MULTISPECIES: dTDP-4-amino-4,6-dideoxy-D-galactose acyltransferase [Yersiniaceae]MBS0971012.1 dTDP-4-amino-4,6-dideoxy-D-galactose acyltransferase [Nissabacter archeti]PLR32282.1 dTDP-4-amino-4,6-dideoxy-D-galactose acyltransferase [Chimaeribacter arupi]PLR43044.1 dTDP-4-amino-4,6-dideoxy-D-galactose acyltransferase [Chimaeribacter arupi]PLR44969.1 dTDP-4-amino-4,6-dideoxy-D-galactose acyltransferase [Chimaeribacter arupi]WKZ92219.1 dTDP-4-amino-4,6-dideoxy-D-galactose acyltransferase [Chim
MRVHANIEPLAWESDFFQRTSAKLHFTAQAAPLTGERLDAYQIVQAKIAAADLPLADALAGLGFRLAEGEVDFTLAVAPDDAAPSHSLTLRPANEADIPALQQAAATAFALSRFRAPWYLPQDSGRFYAQWVTNAVRGSFDHLCLLAEDEQQRPQGFVTLRRTGEHDARIGLLAAWPGAAGRGVGKCLMQAAKQWCRAEQRSHLHVATQSGNVAAMRLYIGSGASVAATSFWLYR